MTIGAPTRAGILDLVFLAATWAGYAQNVAATPEAAISFALMKADPTAAGNMSSNEADYTGYGRMDLTRSGVGFVRTGNSISPVADINYPIGTGGGGNLTHFACGQTWHGGGEPILWSGTITPNVQSGAGIRPILLASSTITLT
jgi:hypothetical protein